MSYYTVTILQMADIPLDEHISAILVAAQVTVHGYHTALLTAACVQYVVGYALSSVLVTRLGRRTLLMASLLLMMLANLGAGLVLLDRRPHQLPANTTAHLAIVEADTVLPGEAVEAAEAEDSGHSVLSFVPVISCVLITFGYACGLGPVPFILFGELFPSEWLMFNRMVTFSISLTLLSLVARFGAGKRHLHYSLPQINHSLSLHKSTTYHKRQEITIIICVCSRYSPACFGSAGSEDPSSPAPSCVAEPWVSNTQCAILPH